MSGGEHFFCCLQMLRRNSPHATPTQCSPPRSVAAISVFFDQCCNQSQRNRYHCLQFKHQHLHFDKDLRCFFSLFVFASQWLGPSQCLKLRNMHECMTTDDHLGNKFLLTLNQHTSIFWGMLAKWLGFLDARNVQSSGYPVTFLCMLQVGKVCVSRVSQLFEPRS